jgi:hypothetical protein
VIAAVNSANRAKIAYSLAASENPDPLIDELLWDVMVFGMRPRNAG